MPLIEMRHICKYYQTGDTVVKALDDVCLTVEEGEMVAVLGRSGSGKSTMMNIVGCLDTPTSGEYWLAGQRVSDMSERALADARSRTVGFVFQGFHLLPQLTALENVELPLTYRGIPERRRRQMAQDSLEQVGLADRMSHLPRELSGGQQQRVAVARAMAGAPSLLLADEPTGNLDSVAGREVMALLHRLHEQGRTVLIITHDPAIGDSCPRRVYMEDGKLKNKQ
ncbi:MAG: ABC transporter ATP-binding protein [Ruminococcaceae bacterium]|nr:ABC transporter ATP-binding protein [Oscillospiraceae bacterium]